MMSAEANKGLIHRFVAEVLNSRNLGVLDELVAPGFENHAAPPQSRHGIDSWKRVLGVVHAIGPEQYTIEDMIAEGDKVAVRLIRSGTHEREMRTAIGVIPPRGKHFAIQNMHIFRLADGKIVEHWAIRDDLGLLQQLGAIHHTSHYSS